MSPAVAVAATSSLAAAAGVRLAAAGGNAVDSALAAILVSMVCEPGVASLAGGGFVTVSPADGSPSVTVDGYVEMPGRGLPPERFGHGVFDVHCGFGGGTSMTVGYGSVATPGTLAALGCAHRQYGRAPWREVVAPAVEAARDGFPMGVASAVYLEFVHDSVFGWHTDSYAALHDARGELIRPGERVRVAHLADSLQLIADEGPDALYRGELGARIAADMAEHDGLVTRADLAAYRPVSRPALTTSMGDWRFATNPPPAIGGVVLTAMLRLMGERPRGAWTAADLAHLVAVQNAVLGYRVEHLDLADDLVTAARELLEQVGTGRLAAVSTAASTVNASVVDAAGTACVVTASAGYGSGVMTPGTGLWLNNCLGEPELNRAGLHALPPGQRLPSNMAPTVARRDDGAVLAVGSPGADRITTALLQVITSYVNGGSSLADAVSGPRLHVRHGPEGPVIEHEENLDLPPVDLPSRSHPPLSMYFGGVGAALREADGRLVAAGDPRRDAVVTVGPT